MPAFCFWWASDISSHSGDCLLHIHNGEGAAHAIDLDKQRKSLRDRVRFRWDAKVDLNDALDQPGSGAGVDELGLLFVEVLGNEYDLQVADGGVGCLILPAEKAD
jgi:hypothetical protein